MPFLFKKKQLEERNLQIFQLREKYSYEKLSERYNLSRNWIIQIIGDIKATKKGEEDSKGRY